MKDWMEYRKARKDREQNDKEQSAKKDAPKTNTAWVRGNVKPVVKTQAPTPAPRPEKFKWQITQTSETPDPQALREDEKLVEQYAKEIKSKRVEQGPPPPIPARPHAKTANPGSDSETSPRGDFPDPPKKPLPLLKKKGEPTPKKNLKQFLEGDHKAPPKPPGVK